MNDFLIRLVIALFAVLLFEKLIEVVTISAQAKQILNLVLIIGAVLFVLFGSIVLHL